MTDEAYLSHVRPSRRQLAWQEMEFYGFIHFGVNTMTDREWGDGTEDPQIFDPSDVDAREWVRVMQDAGMRGVILTAKHHDGFCLWPTATTDHSVASSPWRAGRGDLVREVADACAELGLRFGVYLSPWDRNHPAYGSGTGYDDVYTAQLVELLTGYGEIFSVWLDGANGEGPDGRVQEYDWERYYRVVRALQPEAVISVCGPDVRWCGNEAGETRAEEWSVVPRALQDAERVAEHSQKVDDGTFSRLVRSDEDDLGSRDALRAAGAGVGDLVWYPAEVNTSIRPGWFHHPTEDDQVRTAAELFAIHQRSVGGNATFLLNVPPDRDGRISEPDRQSLHGLGRLVEDFRRRAAASPGRTTVSSTAAASGKPPSSDPVTVDDQLLAPGGGQHWSPHADDRSPWLEVRWDSPRDVSDVVVKELISVGQRIEGWRMLGRGTDGQEPAWQVLAEGQSVGYQRIIALDAPPLTGVRLEITCSRGTPVVQGLGVVERTVDGA